MNNCLVVCIWLGLLVDGCSALLPCVFLLKVNKSEPSLWLMTSLAAMGIFLTSLSHAKANVNLSISVQLRAYFLLLTALYHVYRCFLICIFTQMREETFGNKTIKSNIPWHMLAVCSKVAKRYLLSTWQLNATFNLENVDITVQSGHLPIKCP